MATKLQMYVKIQQQTNFIKFVSDEYSVHGAIWDCFDHQSHYVRVSQVINSKYIVFGFNFDTTFSDIQKQTARFFDEHLHLNIA